jgi:hypothetical protein
MKDARSLESAVRTTEVDLLARPRTSIESLPGLSIANTARFRRRVRLNCAMAKEAALDNRREGLELERLIGDTNNMLQGRAVCKIEVPNGPARCSYA